MYTLRDMDYDDSEGEVGVNEEFETAAEAVEWIADNFEPEDVPVLRSLRFTIPVENRRLRPSRGVNIEKQYCKYVKGFRLESDYEQPVSESYAEEEYIPVEPEPEPEIGELTKEELLKENQRLKKSNQLLMDKNRLNNKDYRGTTRQENALEAYTKAISVALQGASLGRFTIKHNTIDGDAPVGIVQLSDIHFNELINLKHNKYDFYVAAKRLAKLAMHAKTHFKAWGVKRILVACTGDLINNDNIPDKLLNAATNRARASVLATYVLQQFIIDLNQDFDVNVTGVSGNESRIKDEIGFSDAIATDNYDSMILQMLHLLFKDTDVNVFFCGHNEGFVDVNGKTIMLMHGHVLKGTDIEKYVQQIRGRHSSRGLNVDYVLMGHMHSARIGDQYARSSSLCGANDYSEDSLNLSSRASQNIFLVDESAVHGIRVDLQDTTGIRGYDIIKEHEMYNAKSHDKSVRYDNIYKI